MGITDVIMMLMYGMFTIFMVLFYTNFRELDGVESKRMNMGIAIKILGAIAYLMIYDFYYGYGGDSFAYYQDAIKLNDLFMESPIDYFKFVFGSSDVSEVWGSASIDGMNFQKGTSEFTMDVITSFYTWIGIKNYYASTMLMAFTSFVGSWKLYRVFSLRYPDISLYAFIAVFGFPSAIVWSSGFVKENVILMSLGFLIYNAYQIIENRNKMFLRIFVVVFYGFVIYKIKIYVLMALTPAMFLWFINGLIKNDENVIVRRVAKPLFIISIITITLFGANSIRQDIDVLSFDSFIGKAKSYQEWHYMEGSNTSEQHGRGSSYSLGEYDPTVLGTLLMVPASVNVTYFRPYLWEVKNPIMGFVALESLLIFLIFMYILTRKRLYIRNMGLFKDPFLTMLLVYSLIFGFLVGFTSYNFGALDRYKLPAMPFFLFALAIVYRKLRVLKSDY